jgi:hypothetical protein
VISKTRRGFWDRFARLPVPIQKLAITRFQRWRKEPFHPSLQFKELRPALWSVRINDNYRALALRESDLIVWFWIGTHSEYDRLITS